MVGILQAPAFVGASSQNHRTEAEKQKRRWFGNLPKDSVVSRTTIIRPANNVSVNIYSISTRSNEAERQELMKVDTACCGPAPEQGVGVAPCGQTTTIADLLCAIGSVSIRDIKSDGVQIDILVWGTVPEQGVLADPAITPADLLGAADILSKRNIESAWVQIDETCC